MSMIHEAYAEAVRYIGETPKFTEKHTPEETRNFLDALGAPDEGMRIVHVAGTNGKGSVCSYLKSMLEASGYTVGMFISPHLVDPRERISFGEHLIEEEEFVRHCRTVLSRIGEPVRRENYPHLFCGGEPSPELNAGERGFAHPKYFEFYFYIAMLYFAEKKPDFVILETGMGGRLDATNTVRHKEVTVVTRIGLDHMAYLGDTVEKIAFEKACIARRGVPLVTLGEPEEAFRVLKAHAVEEGAPFCPVFSGDSPGEGALFSGRSIGREGIDFSFSGRYHCNDFHIRTTLSTAAVYQRENCALACMAALCLADRGYRITAETVKQGAESAFWAGRMEEIRPGFYIDGGHNLDGINAFLESVRAIPAPARRLLIFSVVSDKQYAGMAGLIRNSGLFDTIVCAPLSTGRTLSAEGLKEIFSDGVTVADSVRDAIRMVTEKRGENDLVFAAGSLYLVGQIMEELSAAPGPDR